jgi:hypothetical protein
MRCASERAGAQITVGPSAGVTAGGTGYMPGPTTGSEPRHLGPELKISLFDK